MSVSFIASKPEPSALSPEPNKDSDVKISKVHGREILDSRGNPTVEVDVTLEGGALVVLVLLLGKLASDAVL